MILLPHIQATGGDFLLPTARISSIKKSGLHLTQETSKTGIKKSIWHDF